MFSMLILFTVVVYGCNGVSGQCESQAFQDISKEVENISKTHAHIKEPVNKLVALHSTPLQRHLHDSARNWNYMFRSSFTLFNKTFMVTRFTFRDFHMSSLACSVYGGYMAELENEEEFNAVANHLKNLTLLSKSVALGAEKRGQQWRYQYTGRAAFTKFAPGQPDNVNYLQSSINGEKGWLMDDNPGYQAVRHALCQIHK